MRCYACNRALSDFESTLKSAVSGEYLDMCNRCLEGLNIATAPNSHKPSSIPDDNEYRMTDDE